MRFANLAIAGDLGGAIERFVVADGAEGGVFLFEDGGDLGLLFVRELERGGEPLHAADARSLFRFLGCFGVEELRKKATGESQREQETLEGIHAG